MAIQSNFPAIKPTLMLDFANVKQLDPRITFTRASTATYYDGRTVAKAEENLLIYSEDFTDTAGRWASSGTTVTANSTVAPNATTTADTLTATSGTSAKFTEQVRSVFSGVVVMSVYVKAGTNNYVQFLNTGDAQAFANFDVTSGAGVVGTKGSKTTSSIVDAGGGWYRCIAVFDATVAYSATYRIYIAPSASATFAQSLAGAGTETIILWGAQLEQRSAVTAYTATITAPITNYIPVLLTAASGVARFDHNPTTDESLGLLIEEQRTNLTNYSEQIDNAWWAKIDATIAANTVVAPDGTLTGDKLIASATNNVHVAFKQSLASSGSITMSVYAKACEYAWLFMSDTNSTANGANFNLTTGTLGVIGANATATIISVGNGWYRCTVTITASAGSGIGLYLASANNTITFTGNGFNGVFIWGAQLEAGAFATSYIPTVASQVTRAADAASMTGTNFSSWYAADQGTVYVEAIAPNSGTSVGIIELSNSAAAGSNYVTVYRQASTWRYRTSTANLNLSPSLTDGSFNKVGFGYSATNYPISVNGTTAQTNTTTGLVSGVNQMLIGFATVTSSPLNGTIKKIAYYPLRVTNAQLQALTG